MRNKQELIQQVVNLLNALIEVDELPPTAPPSRNEQVEMLTSKECAQHISVGLFSKLEAEDYRSQTAYYKKKGLS